MESVCRNCLWVGNGDTKWLTTSNEFGGTDIDKLLNSFTFGTGAWSPTTALDFLSRGLSFNLSDSVWMSPKLLEVRNLFTTLFSIGGSCSRPLGVNLLSSRETTGRKADAVSTSSSSLFTHTVWIVTTSLLTYGASRDIWGRRKNWGSVIVQTDR